MRLQLVLALLLGLTTPGMADQLDLSGSWSNDTPGIGTSVWTLTPRGDGSYDAREAGMGAATGTATFDGSLLQISWVTGAWKGIYTWSLDADGRTGQGQLKFTAGPRAGETFSSKVARQGSATTGQASEPVDISGSWLNDTPGIGTSVWTFTRRGDGSYDAREAGMGAAVGTATFDGSLIQVSWVTGAWKGLYTWSLDANGRTGEGQLSFTAGPRAGQRFPSKVSRR